MFCVVYTYSGFWTIWQRVTGGHNKYLSNVQTKSPDR